MKHQLSSAGAQAPKARPAMPGQKWLSGGKCNMGFHLRPRSKCDITQISNNNNNNNNNEIQRITYILVLGLPIANPVWVR